MPVPEPRASVPFFETLLSLMPLLVGIGAFYLDTATMVYFLLSLTLTYLVFLFVPTGGYSSDISQVLSVGIPIVTMLLSMRKDHTTTCKNVDPGPTSAEDTALEKAYHSAIFVLNLLARFLLSYIVCIVFIYGVLSIRGMSHAEMGPFGKGIRESFGCGGGQEDPPRPDSEPEVIFDEASEAPPPEDAPTTSGEGDTEHRGGADIV